MVAELLGVIVGLVAGACLGFVLGGGDLSCLSDPPQAPDPDWGRCFNASNSGVALALSPIGGVLGKLLVGIARELYSSFREEQDGRH